MRKRRFLGLPVLLSALVSPSVLQGLTKDSPEVASAVQRGVQFLRAQRPSDIGRNALVGLALAKADVPKNDGALQACLKSVLDQFQGGKWRFHQHDVYEAGTVCMFLTAVDQYSLQEQIIAAGQHILDKQVPNGSWDYTGREYGDTSITQFALLGIWEAWYAGLEVDPSVWSRAARWLISHQDKSGGFVYHPNDPRGGVLPQDLKPRHTLAPAGMGCLLICRDMLYGVPATAGISAGGGAGQRSTIGADVTAGALDQAIKRGLGWLSGKWTVVGAELTPSHQKRLGYYLYGLERYASLAKARTIAGQDWYTQATEHLLSIQAEDGSWKDKHGKLEDTCLCLLFLVRSTEKSLKRMEALLGGGNLISGRGIPGTSKGHRTRSGAGPATMTEKEAKQTSVAKLLATMESPDADDFEDAADTLSRLAGDEKQEELMQLGHRLLKLANHRRPELRQAAVRALSRSGDLRHIPLLIDALTDPDYQVAIEARNGLRFISRKILGFGMPDDFDAVQAKAAQVKWRAWYNALANDAGWIK